MQIPHAVVWLDHNEARVLFLHEDDARFETQHLKATTSHAHNHHNDHHHGPDKPFFEAILRALAPAREVLLTGPGLAKTQLRKHAEDHAKEMAARIVGVENLDHPTEAQLAALARKIFRKTDAMLGDPLLR
jgi:stalled ribosome rescue protein Dom34